jgi:hypothetical protein
MYLYSIYEAFLLRDDTKDIFEISKTGFGSRIQIEPEFSWPLYPDPDQHYFGPLFRILPFLIKVLSGLKKWLQIKFLYKNFLAKNLILNHQKYF